MIFIYLSTDKQFKKVKRIKGDNGIKVIPSAECFCAAHSDNNQHNSDDKTPISENLS